MDLIDRSEKIELVNNRLVTVKTAETIIVTLFFGFGSFFCFFGFLQGFVNQFILGKNTGEYFMLAVFGLILAVMTYIFSDAPNKTKVIDKELGYIWMGSENVFEESQVLQQKKYCELSKIQCVELTYSNKHYWIYLLTGDEKPIRLMCSDFKRNIIKDAKLIADYLEVPFSDES